MTIWVPTYDNRRPMIFRFTGSVIPKLVIPVLINAVVSCAVCGLTIGKVVNLSIAPSLITVLSLVVGLLLVFRTNSAYDRYWEGRRLWGQLNASIRNLARTIWVIVKETGDGDKAEKRCAVNLLVAFAVSTKHYLREEYGYEYPDLAPLLEHIPKFGVSFPQGVSPQPVEWPPSPIERGAPSSPSLDSAGGESRTAAAGSAPRARRRKPAAGAGERPPKNIEAFKTAAIAENLPLEITLHLASYIATKRDQDRVDVPQTTFMNAQIAILVDVLTNFERILRSPIPLAYSVHLSQVVWLFCLALPFQFVGTLGWATVPVVALASFSLVGIELIGCEIENPFGYDANDLPLDDFCLMIQRELETLLDLPAPEIATWLKTPTLNVPQSRRAAAAAAAAAADAKPKPN